MTHPIIRFLLAGLNAKQSTRSKPRPPTVLALDALAYTPRASKNWRTLYGWTLGMQGVGLLNADGKHEQFVAVKNWTHKPGDIIRDSNGGKHQKSYMVREDRSLRLIA